MATVSSEGSTTSTAPRIFHLDSSSDSPNYQKCPLCKRFRRYFYCKDCIQSGNVASSKNREELQNVFRALGEIRNYRKNSEHNNLKYCEAKQKCDLLHAKIRQGRDRNRIIRLAVEEKRENKKKQHAKLMEVCKINEERSEKIRAYKTKNEALEDFSSRKSEQVSHVQEKLEEKYKHLKKIAKLRIQQLFKYVFPITIMKPSSEMESSAEIKNSTDKELMKELAEATQTTFIRDKWVYTDYSNEVQYFIVGPSLPGSGNYTNYSLCAQNRDVPISEDTDMLDVNPAFTISAALTYTAQLVNVLSFFLNVRLPHKMVYSEFSSAINEEQFVRRVARLNANILYLCISQNIDISALVPNGTIHNILQIKENESADLGRQGPIEVNDLQVSALEKSISNDLKSSDDSDSDEGDSFTVEWEAVPHIQCPEVPAGPATIQSSQMINTQQTGSMAGGLVNSAVASVASIWRGFTGR